MKCEKKYLIDRLLSYKGQDEIFDMLIKNGANVTLAVTAVEKYGRTLAHLAAQSG